MDRPKSPVLIAVGVALLAAAVFAGSVLVFRQDGGPAANDVSVPTESVSPVATTPTPTSPTPTASARPRTTRAPGPAEAYSAGQAAFRDFYKIRNEILTEGGAADVPTYRELLTGDQLTRSLGEAQAYRTSGRRRVGPSSLVMTTFKMYGGRSPTLTMGICVDNRRLTVSEKGASAKPPEKGLNFSVGEAKLVWVDGRWKVSDYFYDGVQTKC